jgi:hypothetical protein
MSENPFSLWVYLSQSPLLWLTVTVGHRHEPQRARDIPSGAAPGPLMPVAVQLCATVMAI